MSRYLKKSLALLLALAMLMSICACGKAPEAAAPQGATEAVTPEADSSRQELEQIAGLLGDGEAAAELSDEDAIAATVDAFFQKIQKWLCIADHVIFPVI